MAIVSPSRVKPSLSSRLRRAIRKQYWNVVNRFARLAYLNHIVDGVEDERNCLGEIEEIQAIETGQWTKRGYRVHLSITDLPLPEGQSSHWQQGITSRDSYVDWDTLRNFKKMVEDAEYEKKRRKREGREMWVKWFTALAASVGALGGLATLISLYLTYRTNP